MNVVCERPHTWLCYQQKLKKGAKDKDSPGRNCKLVHSEAYWFFFFVVIFSVQYLPAKWVFPSCAKAHIFLGTIILDRTETFSRKNVHT